MNNWVCHAVRGGRPAHPYNQFTQHNQPENINLLVGEFIRVSHSSALPRKYVSNNLIQAWYGLIKN